MDNFLQRLRKTINYNKETGEFHWKTSLKNNQIKIGSMAGTIRRDGRTQIQFDGKLYLAYRLAWLLTYEKWPDFEIDHIDGDPSNNRIDNLRDVNRSENSQNRREPNKNKINKILGVYKQKHDKKWHTRIFFLNKSLYVGRFDTAEEASEAYLKAKRIYHKGCTI